MSENLEKRLAEAEKERDKEREAGNRYIALTDPLISCNEQSCGQCRGCYMERAEAAEQQIATLRSALAAIEDQATQGAFIKHHCPALYACCAIIAEIQALNTPEKQPPEKPA